VREARRAASKEHRGGRDPRRRRCCLLLASCQTHTTPTQMADELVHTMLRVSKPGQLALRPLWDDRGTRSYFDITILRPVTSVMVGGARLHSAGDLAIRGHWATAPHDAVGLLLAEVAAPTSPTDAEAAAPPQCGLEELTVVDAPLLRPPVDFVRVWDTSRTAHCDEKPLFLWQPVAPSEYVSLSCVVTSKPYAPDLESIRCVHQELVVRTAPLPIDGKCLWTSNQELLSSLKSMVFRDPPLPIAFWRVSGATDPTDPKPARRVGDEFGDGETFHGFAAEQTREWTADAVTQPVYCISRARVARVRGTLTRAALAAQERLHSSSDEDESADVW